jgi:hypothetical protein
MLDNGICNTDAPRGDRGGGWQKDGSQLQNRHRQARAIPSEIQSISPSRDISLSDAARVVRLKSAAVVVGGTKTG